MGIPVLILGESGTGKSASMRNFKPEELKVINVANKPLPFKNKFESIPTDDYKTIIKEIKLNKKKITVIDDAQYLMANEFMRRATERGYDKFTEIAQNFWTLVNMVKDLSNDHIVYFMAHIERDQNENEKIKTIGKLLDEKITVEGMFTIVLKTNVTDGKYSFLTQNSGHDTVKSPIGMFPSYAIDNDLKYVDEKIRNYYEIGEFLTDEEIKEIDEVVKRDDIPITDKKKGRRHGKKKEEELAETPVEEKKEETAEETAGETDISGKEVSNTESKSESRRRKSQELAKEREEVEKRNMEAIVNNGLDEATEDEVPFEEVNDPVLEELPTRKTRAKKEEETTTTRRRRRRRA